MHRNLVIITEEKHIYLFLYFGIGNDYLLGENIPIE